MRRSATRRHTTIAPPGRRQPWWPVILVPAAAFLVFAWQVRVPSPWRDEASTMAACRRTFAGLLDMTERIDRVHLLFYLLVKAVLAIDDSVTAARLISVAAMTGAALLLALLARGLGALGVGLAASAVLVAMPLASRWAQDARPAALITLVATGTSWALVAATQPTARRAPWVRYGACIVLLGLTNVLGLLLLPAHGLYLVLTGPMRVVRRWLAASALSVVLLVPWLLLTVGQRDQVAWIQTPHLYDLTGLYIHAFGSRPVVVAVFLGAVAALAVSRGLPGGATGRLFVLGATWAAVPPGVLWSVSFVQPLWDLHYVLFALPGLALMIAAEVSIVTDAVARRLRRSWHAPARAVTAVGVVAVLAALGASAQLAYRDPATGHHGEDSRALAAFVDQHAEPGDGILFAPASMQNFVQTFPQQLGDLAELGLAADPVQSDTLFGQPVPAAELPRRLAGHDRIWLLTRDVPEALDELDAATVRIVQEGRRVTQAEHVPGFQLQLYQA